MAGGLIALVGTLLALILVQRRDFIKV